MDKFYDKEDINKIIGRNIAIERKQRAIKREDLAEILGVSTSHMGLMERGERGVHALHFTKLSDIFDIPVSDFFTGGNRRRMSVLKARDSELQENQETISTLARNLNKSEVEYVVSMLRGIIAMRNDND